MFGKDKKKKRFIIKEEQLIGMAAIQVIVDTETGVNYLNTVGSGTSGLTPLLDADGNIIVTPASELTEE